MTYRLLNTIFEFEIIFIDNCFYRLFNGQPWKNRSQKNL